MPHPDHRGAAIVTTMRNAGRVLDSFVAYHLAIGFSHLYLIFDDPHDPDLARIGTHPAVTAIAHDSALRQSWRGLPRYAEQAEFIDKEVMARQVLNVELAMGLAREAGYGWLLHIDADELFYAPQQSAAEHFAAVDRQSFDTVRYLNFEAVPERDDIDDFFREVDLFKVPPSLAQVPVAPATARLVQATPQLLPNFFHFYSIGKSAVRLSAMTMHPIGVHDFIRSNGDYPGTLNQQNFILHYPCCGFESLWTKYVTLGRFPDRWWKKYDIAAAIGPFHLQARDVVATGDKEAAKHFYRTRVAVEGRTKADALIAAGLLRRITGPKTILGAYTS